MAERRMFAKTIIDSDAFIDMPTTTRLLYYDLGMRADDDGFVNSPKKIMRMIGASEDDMRILIAKKFIIPFESGVVVIKHWRIHNYIQSDRHKETTYKEELSQLELDENKAYRLSVNSMDTECIQTVSSLETQVRLGKDRLGEVSLVEVNNKGGKKFTPPTYEELSAYAEEIGSPVNIDDFMDYYDSNGWMVGKTKMKDWKATLRRWSRNRTKSKEKSTEELKDMWEAL